MPRHIGMYLNFAVNIYVTTALLGIFIENDWIAFGITILLMVSCICVTFSPFGTWLLRMQCNLQEPNEFERSRIDPIFQRVYQKALSKTSGLPQDILWYIHNDDSINAFAVGLHTIGINVGMLNYCDDDEIAAVLAHEFAHIAHRDALATSLSVQSNYLALLGKTVAILSIKVLGAGLALIFVAVSEDDIMGLICNLMTKLTCWIFDIYISVIFTICLAISYASCRQQEYGADQYAAELGFKEQLIHVFRRLPTTSASTFTANIAHMLYGTHPKTEDRIQRLETYSEFT